MEIRNWKAKMVVETKAGDWNPVAVIALGAPDVDDALAGAAEAAEKIMGDDLVDVHFNVHEVDEKGEQINGGDFGISSLRVVLFGEAFVMAELEAQMQGARS
jgi:hypothetical protein